MKNPLADTSKLDFLAASMYASDRRRQNSIPVRWLCLDEKLQQLYLEQARTKYIAWVEDERGAEVRRAAS